MNLLALCGSLRARSLNRAALTLLAEEAPPLAHLTLFDGVRELPAFDPDAEALLAADSAPQLLRRAASEAAGLVIACPEYAHGLPGAFKNALDWLVGCEAFCGKPVMQINTAPRAVHAQAQLREILATMAAVVVDEASVSLPLREGMSEAEIASAAHRQALRAGLEAFVARIRAG